VDSALNIQWTRTDGGPSFDHLNDMVLNKDNSYTGIGFSGSDESDVSEVTGNHGSIDTWLVKVGYCDSIVDINPSGAILFIPGESKVLTAPWGETYLWSNGETTQSINASKPGAYTVKIARLSGACVRTSSTTHLVINDFPGIFSNPGSDQISLSLNLDKAENAVLAVYNTIGEKMLQQVIPLSSGISINVINIQGLNPGIYVLEIKNDSGILGKKKFMKQ
jgi:hypothetical protein